MAAYVSVDWERAINCKRLLVCRRLQLFLGRERQFRELIEAIEFRPAVRELALVECVMRQDLRQQTVELLQLECGELGPIEPGNPAAFFQGC